MLNRKDTISIIKKETNLDEYVIQIVINRFVSLIKHEMMTGNKFNIHELGLFYPVTLKKGGKNNNPKKAGEQIVRNKDKKTFRFKASRAFVDSMNKENDDVD
jgi:nucleoid DNA-binding protein